MSELPNRRRNRLVYDLDYVCTQCGHTWQDSSFDRNHRSVCPHCTHPDADRGDTTCWILPTKSTPIQTNTGRKDDADKPRWDLVPWAAFACVVDVLTYGAKKYGDDNYLEVKDHERRYFAAAMRHLVAYKNGEHLDPESGMPHLAHAITSLLFLETRDPKMWEYFDRRNKDDTR